MAIGGLALLVFLGLLIYQFMYVSDARIIGENIVLKKKFRPAKTYSFDRIGYPTSFKIKTTKYVTVEMKNDDQNLEKYLIVNSNALFSFEKKDAEQTLKDLRNLALSKKISKIDTVNK